MHSKGSIYLGIGEKIHEPLRKIFKKVQSDFPNVNQKFSPKTSVKSIYDTINEKGLVPSILLLLIRLRFPILSIDIPILK